MTVGIHCTAHLSGLIFDNYPILGITSMEDRTKLFDLIQKVRSLCLHHGDHDIDCGIDGDDECRAGAVTVDASHDRKTEPEKSNISTTPVHLWPDNRRVLRGKSNHGIKTLNHYYDHPTAANTKAVCVSSHKPKLRSETVTSVRVGNTQVKHKERKRISWKKNLCVDKSRKALEHMNVKTPVYESRRTTDCIYGLHLTSSSASQKK